MPRRPSLDPVALLATYKEAATMQGCTVGEFIGFDLVSKEAARG